MRAPSALHSWLPAPYPMAGVPNPAGRAGTFATGRDGEGARPMAAVSTTSVPTRKVTVGYEGEEAMRSLRFTAVVALVLLSGLDLFVTRWLLGHGAREANPLMALVIDSPWGIALKLGLPAFVGWRHLVAPLSHRMVTGLGLVCVMYLGVLAWNLHVANVRFGL